MHVPATAALTSIGRFAAVRNALIDDCALAAKLKSAGERNWLGLSHSVMSRRQYRTLADFWRMVSRSAFTQLRYSCAVLIGTTVVMAVVFVAPLAGIASAYGLSAVPVIGALALAAMAAAYVPLVRFYGLPSLWALAAGRRSIVSCDDVELSGELLARHARHVEESKL